VIGGSGDCQNREEKGGKGRKREEKGGKGRKREEKGDTYYCMLPLITLISPTDHHPSFDHLSLAPPNAPPSILILILASF